MNRSLRLGLGVAVAIGAGQPVRAQCATWDERFSIPGVNVEIESLAVFDDGSGPALYAGGVFSVAGDSRVNHLVRWDGSTWSAVGSGSTDDLRDTHALCVFDDGGGPALYAGGAFTTAGGVSAKRIARWDGSNWAPLGTGLNDDVLALAVFDDGSGAALYAAGDFTTAGGTSASRIARWDGSSWSALGTGVSGGTLISVSALATYDDGSGSALFVAGRFTTAGGISASRVAKWDGSAWSALGSGIGPSSSSFVDALASFDDGSGASLYAAGFFSTAGGSGVSNIAKWNGSSWSALGTGTDGKLRDLIVFDDGAGSALYATGAFDHAGGVRAQHIAKWDGTAWAAMGGGLSVLSHVHAGGGALALYDDGGGPALFVGGGFDHVDGAIAMNLAKWSGSSWSPLTTIPALARGAGPLCVHDDGSGSALYVGGSFFLDGTTDVSLLVRWDGATWAGIGGLAGTPSEVDSLGVFDDGSGPALYAGGHFVTADGMTANNIAKWDGANWSVLSTGLVGSFVFVDTLCVFDDGSGPALYAGGSFTTAGGVSANHVAKWDGSAWSALGSGMDGFDEETRVRTLCVFDDGSGAALFAGGGFTMAGGVAATSIAKWNGSSWTSVGSGVGPLGSVVYALEIFDDGSGPALFAGGTFVTAGGGSANRIAKWNGSSWSALGAGATGAVTALHVFDDGAGSALYVAGSFFAVPDLNYLRRWDGSNWSTVGTVWEGTPGHFATFDDGVDGIADLYLTGTFTGAGNHTSFHMAEWRGCGPPGAPYCYGDGVDPAVTSACPCGNVGFEGHGCANSNASLGGGLLSATGTTSPNTVVFTCTGIPNNAFATFLRSPSSNSAGSVFGDGIKCLTGATIRFGGQTAGQAGNAPFTVVSGTASIAPGNTRYYQTHYRNPNAGFCPPEAFNISNAYRVAW